MEKYAQELKIGLSALQEATRICRRIRDRFAWREFFQKTDRSPVTIADFASQAVITAALLKAFPGDAIVGEENADLIRKDEHICDEIFSMAGKELGDYSARDLADMIDYGKRPFDSGKRFWTVDPIDGTKGYIAGRGYAVTLALMEEKNVGLGLMSCPGLKKSPDGTRQGDCILYAVRRAGAWVLETDGRKAERVFRKDRIPTAEVRLCESVEPSHAAHQIHARVLECLGSPAPPLRMDSQAKYGAVALGLADVYLRVPRKTDYREKIWDHAAGVLIVREAGGEVSDILGRPLDFSKGETLKENFGVVVSAGGVHSEVLSAVERAIRPC